MLRCRLLFFSKVWRGGTNSFIYLYTNIYIYATHSLSKQKSGTYRCRSHGKYLFMVVDIDFKAMYGRLWHVIYGENYLQHLNVLYLHLLCGVHVTRSAQLGLLHNKPYRQGVYEQGKLSNPGYYQKQSKRYASNC